MVQKSRSLIRRRGLSQAADYEKNNLNESPVAEEVNRKFFFQVNPFNQKNMIVIYSSVYIKRSNQNQNGDIFLTNSIHQVIQLTVSPLLAASNFNSSSCYTSGPFTSPSSPSMSITHIEWKIKLKTD